MTAIIPYRERMGKDVGALDAKLETGAEVQALDAHEGAFMVRDSAAPLLLVLTASVLLSVWVGRAGSLGLGLSVLLWSYAAWALLRLTRRPERLLVTEEGIVDHTYWGASGAIPWEDILDVRPTRWGLIEIDLRDENAFWEGLSPLQRFARIKTQLYGYGPAVLAPHFLAASRGELIERMQAGLDAHVLAEARRTKALGAAGPEAEPEDAAPV